MRLRGPPGAGRGKQTTPHSRARPRAPAPGGQEEQEPDRAEAHSPTSTSGRRLAHPAYRLRRRGCRARTSLLPGVSRVAKAAGTGGGGGARSGGCGGAGSGARRQWRSGGRRAQSARGELPCWISWALPSTTILIPLLRFCPLPFPLFPFLFF